MKSKPVHRIKHNGPKNRSKDWKQWPNPLRIAFICYVVVTIYINDCYLGNFNYETCLQKG